MRNGFVLLSVLLVPGTLAADVDKHQIRQTLRLPSILLQQRLEINTSVGPYLSGQQPDIKQEIASIQKELQGNNSDAERYARLGELLDQLGDSEQSTKASKHAAALFRQRLQADPDNALLLAQLGRSLGMFGHHKEAEKRLRQAVQHQDAGWQCWTLLGEYLQERAVPALFAAKGPTTGRFLDGVALAQYFSQGTMDPESVRKTVALLKEALSCFNKAVELTPQQSETFHRRAVGRFVADLLRPALQAALCERAPLVPLALPVSAGAAHDFHWAAQLQPDDPMLVGTAACYQFVVSAARGKQIGDEERQRLLDHLGRLKHLAADPRPDVAARALNFLAFLHFLPLNDEDLAVKYYRQTLQIDPGNDSAWDMMTFLALRSGRLDEAIRLCQERLKLKQTAHNYFLLAKAHVEKRAWQQAEAALRTGVQVDAKHFCCTLGLAVALLHHEGDAKARKEAFAQLHKASLLVGQPPRAEREQEVTIAEAAYHALYGEIHIARKKLTRLSLLEPENDQVRQLLKVVGE
jgi:tetratricopeptide (TPR) repeat protein